MRTALVKQIPEGHDAVIIDRVKFSSTISASVEDRIDSQVFGPIDERIEPIELFIMAEGWVLHMKMTGYVIAPLQ